MEFTIAGSGSLTLLRLEEEEKRSTTGVHHGHPLTTVATKDWIKAQQQCDPICDDI